MESEQPSVGAYLREVRISKGLSLREAAKRIGINHSRVVDVEKGVDSNRALPFVPSYELLLRFADAYGLPPDELFRRAGREPLAKLSEDEWKLLRRYRALEPALQLKALDEISRYPALD